MKDLMTGVAFILLLLFSQGCKKDLPDCEAKHWGTLRFYNSSSQDVRVYMDNIVVTDVTVGTNVEIGHVAAGYHTVHAQQISSQQVWDNNVLVEQCRPLNVAFTP